MSLSITVLKTWYSFLVYSIFFFKILPVQAADIEIQAKEILFIREVLNTYIAEYCDQPKDKIEADCDRDFFMTPEEAVSRAILLLLLN